MFTLFAMLTATSIATAKTIILSLTVIGTQSRTMHKSKDAISSRNNYCRSKIIKGNAHSTIRNISKILIYRGDSAKTKTRTKGRPWSK